MKRRGNDRGVVDDDATPVDAMRTDDASDPNAAADRLLRAMFDGLKSEDFSFAAEQLRVHEREALYYHAERSDGYARVRSLLSKLAELSAQEQQQQPTTDNNADN